MQAQNLAVPKWSPYTNSVPDNRAFNTSFQINGSSPYQVVSQWLDPINKKMHVFRSDDIWYDPSSLLIDNSINVYIDPQNYKRYHVDLSNLPKLA